MRLIDADACIDYIRNNNQHAWEALAYAPTIDAVAVVRCKDCKWYNCNACFRDDGAENHRNSEDFCSYGERKEL